MLSNLQLNVGQQFPDAMMSLIASSTPTPQLPAPIPLLGCMGILIRGKGSLKQDLFQCCSEMAPSDIALKAQSIF